MSLATLEAPALEFDFDTLGLDLLALDETDDQPGDPLACSNIDQGNEHPAPFHPSSHPNPEVLFTDNQMFTIEDDEAPAALEAEPLSPLQLPASIPAAIQASMEAPAPIDPLTRRQKLSLEIEALESQVVEYSETEFELAEKVSQVRKWRKEALENLRALKWQLNAMSEEDAEKPVDMPKATHFAVARAGKPEGNRDIHARDSFMPLPSAPQSGPAVDHGGAQSLTALGVTPKQLEKFEIEGIRTVSQFERALADRSIENVRGIQERTLDKLRESLWEFRKANPIPDPDDRPVLTASERDAKIEPAHRELPIEPEVTATEAPPAKTAESPAPEDLTAPTPEQSAVAYGKPSAIIGQINLATDPLTPPLAEIILQAGRDARTAGFTKLDNPLRTGATVHREDLWNDGWDEVDQEFQEIAKKLSAGVRGEPGEAAGAPSEVTGEEKATKPARKPRAKKAKAEATKSPDPFELYQTVKAKFPDYTLFVRVGDFYELFCEDAEKTAELFGLTLTVGKRGDSPAIPMIGFPAYQLEEYEAKASEAGHKVHIFEPK
jgi:hypothetical protein